MVGIVGGQAWGLVANRAAASGDAVTTSPLPLQEHTHTRQRCHHSDDNVPAIFTQTVPGMFTQNVPLLFSQSVPA
jgi:hypothetical protein